MHLFPPRDSVGPKTWACHKHSGDLVDKSAFTEQVIILLFIYIAITSVSESFSYHTKLTNFHQIRTVWLKWLYLCSRHEIHFGGPEGVGIVPQRVIFQDSKIYDLIRDPYKCQVRDLLRSLRRSRWGNQRNKSPKLQVTARRLWAATFRELWIWPADTAMK